MRPFFCFYGGKWRAAPLYPAPTHDVLVEPFAGAAGYATRYADRRVILVEKDPSIADLWRYLIGVSSAEVRRIPLLGPEQTVDDLPAHPEVRALVGFWLSKGSAQPKRSPSSWMRAGTHATSFWGEAVRERIARQVDCIRHWRVIEGDYSSAPDVKATWFVDPPYQRQGRHYRCSSAAIDFVRLGEWCRSRRGQVVVCEQDGASWLPFRPFATIKANESRNGRKRSCEAIWTNETGTETSQEGA